MLGSQAALPGPHTSTPHPEHRICPYLLREMTIRRLCEVWCADLTYVPMHRGFMYLVAVMDWFSRYVLAWDVSNSMDGRGRALDNVFIERLWRSVKYEDIYLHDYADGHELHAGLSRYFRFYNHEPPHSALEEQTPAHGHKRR